MCQYLSQINLIKIKIDDDNGNSENDDNHEDLDVNHNGDITKQLCG